MSTETPGGFSAVMIATVEMASTRVEVSPPWRAPARLRWLSSSFSSHDSFPGVAEVTSTCGSAIAWCAHTGILQGYIYSSSETSGIYTVYILLYY